MANEANHTGPLAKGETRWHSSGEDEGPDVGLELGLGGGVALYVGELATRRVEEAGVDLKRFPDGWWFALNDMGETRIVAAVTDQDAARELFETIGGWVRAASQEPSPVVETLANARYLTSEPHLSGHRVILGFDTLDGAIEASTAIAKAVFAVRPKPAVEDDLASPEAPTHG